jgi:WD40 repeat protein
VTLVNLENPKVPPRALNWKGIHGVVTYSPNGKWVVSAMQDQTLHLWRLSDGHDLHMRGYPAKIHSLSWSYDGDTLATSGGAGVPLWNFKGPNGPAGMAAKVVGESPLFQEDTVHVVAAHPNGPFVAAGWRKNGLHLIDILQDKSVPLLLDAMLGEGQMVGPVTALAWRPDGHMLAMGSQKAALCVIDFKSLLG